VDELLIGHPVDGGGTILIMCRLRCEISIESYWNLSLALLTQGVKFFIDTPRQKD
jgi:hypothetical protein